MWELSVLQGQVSSLLEIYRTAATGHPSDLSRDLWGVIPTSFRKLKKMIKKRQETVNFSAFSDNIELLRRIAVDKHQKMGTFTVGVKSTLDRLDRGFLDLGHQPLLFGGPVFLSNKIALAEWVGNLLGIGTFFFIGDHDSIQNELTIARFPQANSPHGLVITQQSWGVPENTPMHQVPLPNNAWIQEIKDKIQENLRSLMKSSKIRLEYRQLLLERFLSWFDLIYDKIIPASDFSFWTQQIWSQLFNVRNELGLFISSISDPRYRQLILPGFEFLLAEDNRSLYIKTLNTIHDLLTSQNLQPGLPYRDDGYVPFFLECLKCKNKTRVELLITIPGELEGKCSVCSEEYSFSYNSNRPDLSEIGANISPRSDSRAVVNNYTFPLLTHIGGAGETQYYSAVIPAMKRLGVLEPILIRSNRVYYNTPWAEKAASVGKSPILNETVYAIFKDFNKSTENQNIQNSLEKMRILLETNYKRGINNLKRDQEHLSNNPQNQKLRKEIKNTELMLSHNFGRYSPGKKAQEVSWNWLDLAVLTGIHNICNTFQRQLREEAFPGYTWYITPGRFT